MQYQSKTTKLATKPAPRSPKNGQNGHTVRRTSSPPAVQFKAPSARPSEIPEPQAPTTSGRLKEQAWVEPELSAALTEWGTTFEQRSGMRFTSRAEMIRAFLISHLGFFAGSIRLKA